MSSYLPKYEEMHLTHGRGDTEIQDDLISVNISDYSTRKNNTCRQCCHTTVAVLYLLAATAAIMLLLYYAVVTSSYVPRNKKNSLQRTVYSTDHELELHALDGQDTKPSTAAKEGSPEPKHTRTWFVAPWRQARQPELQQEVQQGSQQATPRKENPSVGPD
jgi:hypothetical protein